MNTIHVKFNSNQPIPVKTVQCGNTMEVTSSDAYDYKILHGEIVAETNRATNAEEALQQQVNIKQDLGYIALDEYMLSPDCGEITNIDDLNRLRLYLVNKVSVNANIYYLTLSNDDMLVYFCTTTLAPYNQVSLHREDGRFQLENIEVGTTYHNKLHNLDWSNSGHTGFAGIDINTTSYWEAHSSYRPDRGMIVVYTDYQDGKPAIKVGTGNADLSNLPFINEGISNLVVEHIANRIIHITQEERDKWNNKVNIIDTPQEQDMLVFTRN